MEVPHARALGYLWSDVRLQFYATVPLNTAYRWLRARL